MMKTDFKHFKEILNLIESDIMPQEIAGVKNVISAAERLTVEIRFLARGQSFGCCAFNLIFLIEQYSTL